VSHAKKSGKIEWREVVRSSPPPLPEDLINSISLVYRAYANELTGRKWFDVPPLAEVLNKLEEVLME
ncbi:MAG: phosphoribosylaminoimidazolesuccinocarboxamide synthase, partial [Candidatus Syntrophoarchaeum sp. WYZ-LMO15]